VAIHPVITFWIFIISAAIAIFVFIANVIYVRKFIESVDIQRKTSQGALILTINNQFFYNEPHRRIIRSLDEGKGLRTMPGGMSDTELDDHIGMLDSIGTFVKNGILDERLVWAFFSHYVESAYESKEIKEYVDNCQQNYSRTFFEDFVWLYQTMKAITAARAA
jgi:hypothetical protein